MSWLETGACLQKLRVLESLILGPERKTLFLREELGVTLTFLGIQELHGQKKTNPNPRWLALASSPGNYRNNKEPVPKDYS